METAWELAEDWDDWMWMKQYNKWYYYTQEIKSFEGKGVMCPTCNQKLPDNKYIFATIIPIGNKMIENTGRNKSSKILLTCGMCDTKYHPYICNPINMAKIVEHCPYWRILVGKMQQHEYLYDIIQMCDDEDEKVRWKKRQNEINSIYNLPPPPKCNYCCKYEGYCNCGTID